MLDDAKEYFDIKRIECKDLRTCQLLGWSLVSWSSQKKNSVALSTAEAEYISAGVVVLNYFG